MAEQCPGFSYRFAYDSKGVCNGVLWMTATMRENFRRFGSSISLDAMKRGINTYLWNYFAVVMINDVNSNCLATEGRIVAEREDAYKFIIESTISMGLEVRKNTEIYCVARDGIFNQNSLLKWNLPNSSYITDQWHLFTHTLPKRFGKNVYEYISQQLRDMTWSKTEEEFEYHFSAAKDLLHKKKA